MRFEKLNDNKIKIIITDKDLKEKHIDFHSFMANPIESQTIFFDILNEAEKEIGFTTKNYNIKIEAMQISGGDFVITVTRSIPDTTVNSKTDIKKKIHVKRKKLELNTNNLIYCFNNFDDFCEYSNYLSKNNINFNSVAKNISLYEYKNTFYLIFSNLNLRNLELKKVFTAITEFATYKNNSDIFKRNLNENGKLIMKNNAIKTAIEYFK